MDNTLKKVHAGNPLHVPAAASSADTGKQARGTLVRRQTHLA
jgi:hypothetical protein